jgi:hypothetical protein
MSSKNLSQPQFAPSERIAHGQTLTLEEYKALQSQGEEPMTMTGDRSRGGIGYGKTGLHNPHYDLDSYGRAANRRQARALLGLQNTEQSYGNPYAGDTY